MDNRSNTRTSVAKVIKSLLNYPDARGIIFQLKPPESWLEYMHDPDTDALGVFTEIFCFLVNNEYIHTGILQAILDAQNALDDSTASVRARGATVLLTMGKHARLRDILAEVCIIHACIERYIEGATRRDTDMILQRMEYFGILKSL
ncbi:hypothetical protein M408DRAFT_279082 [Serendipita vermifera MAFF 305830]|uniref:Condensin complex subunit 1 C-terminal domain-containing protein n=1 Tax=Serendipita vermifera MAFF 305830 TaxID=933852 RepID=A0A0C3AUB3_SERVB|nr:hypothetical protein M408DRAFT_279082 [Serendipita vermifera MAFF 305830]